MERSPTDSGSWGFPLSACCIRLQPPLATQASPKHLSLLQLMTTSFYANSMATQLAWSTGEQVGGGGITP